MNGRALPLAIVARLEKKSDQRPASNPRRSLSFFQSYMQSWRPPLIAYNNNQDGGTQIGTHLFNALVLNPFHPFPHFDPLESNSIFLLSFFL
jgi:hypothetical protein